MNYRNLIYTSPSGVVIDLAYNGVLSDSVDHGLGEFSFAGVDGKYYQDSNISTGDYPFELIITNEDDLSLVRSVINEKSTDGVYGVLQHPDPTLGTFPVVISSASFEANTVTDINNARVSITFFRNAVELTDTNVNSAIGMTESIISAISVLNTNQATDFANALSGSQRVTAIDTIINSISSMTESIKPLTKTVSEISIQFMDLSNDILDNIDDLIYTPLILANKIQNLVQLPMYVGNSVNSRIAGYNNYLNVLLVQDSQETIGISNGDSDAINNVASKSLFVLGTISALNYCAVTGKSYSIDELKDTSEDFDFDSYYSRSKVTEVLLDNNNSALAAIEFLSDISESFSADTFFSQYIDYSILSKSLLVFTNNALNYKLLSLPVEKTFTLLKPTTIIKICAYYYESLETNVIQFFIKSNGITGKDIFLLNTNTEFKIY